MLEGGGNGALSLGGGPPLWLVSLLFVLSSSVCFFASPPPPFFLSGDLEMDLQQIATTLRNTFSAHEQERKAAEQQLVQFQSVPGYVVGLLQMMTANDAPLPIRQAAAIQFKTLLQKKWVR